MKSLDRRDFIRQMAAGTSALAAGGASSMVAGCTPSTAQTASQSDEEARTRTESSQRSPEDLAQLAYRPLPLGSIKPRGWLERQFRIQAAGLSGHLDEFWPDVAQSQWFGGEADGWERAPYWLECLASGPTAGSSRYRRNPRSRLGPAGARTTCGRSC
jgi:hypothetical protein